MHPCGTCDTTSKPAPVRRMPSALFGLRNIFNQPSMRRRTKIYCGSHQIDACTKMRGSSNISCSLSWDYTIWQNILDCKVHKFWCSFQEKMPWPWVWGIFPTHPDDVWVSPTKKPSKLLWYQQAMTGNSRCQKDEHLQQTKPWQTMKVHEASGTFERIIQCQNGETQQLFVEKRFRWLEALQGWSRCLLPRLCRGLQVPWAELGENRTHHDLKTAQNGVRSRHSGALLWWESLPMLDISKLWENSIFWTGTNLGNHSHLSVSQNDAFRTSKKVNSKHFL